MKFRVAALLKSFRETIISHDGISLFGKVIPQLGNMMSDASHGSTLRALEKTCDIFQIANQVLTTGSPLLADIQVQRANQVQSSRKQTPYEGSVT